MDIFRRRQQGKADKVLTTRAPAVLTTRQGRRRKQNTRRETYLPQYYGAFLLLLLLLLIGLLGTFVAAGWSYSQLPVAITRFSNSRSNNRNDATKPDENHAGNDMTKSSPSKDTTETGLDEKTRSFQIAERRFQNRLKEHQLLASGDTTIPTSGYRDLSEMIQFEQQQQQQHGRRLSIGRKNLFRAPRRASKGFGRRRFLLNSIRVPKAGSSALSITSRALAGCQPDGYPCCQFPGDPPGSCPQRNLMCGRVLGCTGHSAQFGHDHDLPVITSVREPTARLLSGFFYAPPHRPAGPDHGWEFFQKEFIQQPTFRNVLTKMLCGTPAYQPFIQERHTVDKAQRSACLMPWFALVEMPILSSLLLYEATPFSYLIPNPVTFGLLPAEANEAGMRVNHHPEYYTFKTNSFVKNNGTALVREYNQPDFDVYDFMSRLFCLRVRETNGLLDDARSAGIATDEINQCQTLLAGHEGLTTLDLCPS